MFGCFHFNCRNNVLEDILEISSESETYISDDGLVKGIERRGIQLSNLLNHLMSCRIVSQNSVVKVSPIKRSVP